MPSGNFHYYLDNKLNADVNIQDSKVALWYVVKFRFTSLYGNWQLDLDLHLTGSWVPGYILPPFEKTSSRCFKINTYQLNQNLQLYKMHIHFTQLYIAGNFPCLTNVVRISGREWGPTRPSHHLNLFPLNRLYTKLAKSQTVRIHLSNLTCSFLLPM